MLKISASFLLAVTVLLAASLALLPEGPAIAAWCPQYTLTVVSSPDGAGTFQLLPVASNNIYDENTPVTITAVPSPGYLFDHWEGDLSGTTNPAETVMTENKSVTAILVPAPRYSLIVSIATPDTGTVTLSVPQPEGGYLAGDNISLTAEAAPGYAFNHWEGALEGGANPYDLLITENTSVTAVFYPAVQVICNPSNGGTVTAEPPGSSNSYEPGSQVALSADAAEGYVFNGWSGDASGFDNPLTITVDGPKNLTANFLAQTSFPWRWAIIGIVGFFLVTLLAFYVRSEMSKS